jgi:hypothetical protein
MRMSLGKSLGLSGAGATSVRLAVALWERRHVLARSVPQLKCRTPPVQLCSGSENPAEPRAVIPRLVR